MADKKVEDETPFAAAASNDVIYASRGGVDGSLTPGKIAALANQISNATVLSADQTLDQSHFGIPLKLGANGTDLALPAAPATVQVVQVYADTFTGSVNGVALNPGDMISWVSIANAWMRGPSYFPSTPYTDEQVRDVIGAALVQLSGITITVNDAGDTISFQATFDAESARDIIGAALVAGTGISIAVNDGADTITISSQHGNPFKYPKVSGNALYQWPVGPGTDGSTMAAGSMYCGAFICEDDFTVERLTFRIGSVVVASSSVQFAIYASDATSGLPTGNPIWTSANQASDTANADKQITGISLALTKGSRYWIAVMPSAAVRVFTMGSIYAGAEGYRRHGSTGSNLGFSGSAEAGALVKTGLSFGTWPTLTGNRTTDGLAGATNNFVPAFSMRQ